MSCPNCERLTAELADTYERIGKLQLVGSQIAAERDELKAKILYMEGANSYGLLAERDRLAGEIKSGLETYERTCADHRRLVLELEDLEKQYHAFERSKGAECERLRAALERIAELGIGTNSPEVMHYLLPIRRIAREALAGAEQVKTGEEDK